MTRDAFNSLAKIFELLRVDAKSESIDSVITYAGHVIEANRKYNLTGASTVEEFIEGPLFDALTVLPVIESSKNLVDIGSGSGLPGVPIAVMNPDMDIWLAEPKKKRSDFLFSLKKEMNFRFNVIRKQDRELPASCWDGAVAQAVFSLSKWLKRGKRLVRNEGCVYALSSVEPDESWLPEKAHFEKKVHLNRPKDGAARFSCRIRIKKDTA